MLTLELSSSVLEIPDDAYSTLSQTLIVVQHSVKSLQADWLILENYEKATLNINMPYWLTAGVYLRRWVITHNLSLGTFGYTLGETGPFCICMHVVRIKIDPLCLHLSYSPLDCRGSNSDAGKIDQT